MKSQEQSLFLQQILHPLQTGDLIPIITLVAIF
jgi:hypothetical protein